MSTSEEKRQKSKHQPVGRWITPEKRMAIYERDGFRCQRCEKYLRNIYEADKSQVTLDHIVRKADGGSNDKSNLITCCKSCNSANLNEGTMEDMKEKVKKNSKEKQEEPASMEFRDRIIEVKKLDASVLVPHHMNFRNHNSQQKATMKAVLAEVGRADTLVVYKSEREEGKYVIIDGHMRANDFGGEWWCAITDLTDEEADKYLMVHDPISMMADHDHQILDELKLMNEFNDAAIDVLMDGIDWQWGSLRPKRHRDKEDEFQERKEKDLEEKPRIEEMELRPFEHYNYVLVLASNTHDWNLLSELMELKVVEGSPDPRHSKIGIGRAVTAEKFFEVIDKEKKEPF